MNEYRAISEIAYFLFSSKSSNCSAFDTGHLSLDQLYLNKSLVGLVAIYQINDLVLLNSLN